MPTTRTLLLFIAAALTLNVTPGPDILYVTARSIGQGRVAGMVSALGLAVGYGVHTLAAASGLAALLRASALLYAAVRIAGAAYLITLGVTMLRSQGAAQESLDLPPERSARIFRQGTLTSALNPKVALFFLAFLPQFADAERGPVLAQIVLFGAIFTTTATTVHIILALVTGSVGDRVRARPGWAQSQARIAGGVLVALGVAIVAEMVG